MTEIVRNMGIHIVAGRGSGKSTLMGRKVAYTDFMSGIPMLIIDPHGGTIDNFLDQVMYLPEDVQRRLAHRIEYIDMSGKAGYVAKFPLYYRLPTDTIRDVAYRFLSIIRRLDPQLANAPIWGWNPFEKVGVNVGIILYALGLPITEAPYLLSQPKEWTDRLTGLKYSNAETVPAVDWFLNEYAPQRPEERKRDASTFLSKIQPFTHDRIMELMFASNKPTIDWPQAVAEGKAILLDFRFESDPRFKILWALTNFLEYVQLRGINRTQPISVIVDELSYLLSLSSYGTDLLSADMDELINKTARNNNLWLTLAHQEMHQVSERIQKTLMSMGTQLIGYTTNAETARMYSRRFWSYSPDWVKKKTPVRNRWETVIDFTTTEYSPQEQEVMGVRPFMRLGRFEFFLSTASTEGASSERIKRVKLDLKSGVNQPLVEEARRGLLRRSCESVTDRAAAPRPIVWDEPQAAPVRPVEAQKQGLVARPRSGVKTGTNPGTS